MSERPGDLSVNVNVNLPDVRQSEDDAPYSTGLGYGLWCTGLLGACGIHRSTSARWARACFGCSRPGCWASARSSTLSG